MASVVSVEPTTASLQGGVCLVTVGLGLIGSNLVHRLIAEGARKASTDRRDGLRSTPAFYRECPWYLSST